MKYPLVAAIAALALAACGSNESPISNAAPAAAPVASTPAAEKPALEPVKVADATPATAVAMPAAAPLSPEAQKKLDDQDTAENNQ